MESMTFVGIMIAALTFGVLADSFGRKHVLMFSLLITVIASICETFATNFWTYLAFQTLGSLGDILVSFIMK